MGRILAIDYGLKRCGIAVTDTLRISANPLECVMTVDLMKYLDRYFAVENVDCLVLGKPRQMNGQDSQSWGEIDKFSQICKEKYPNVIIEFEDERFTSKMASRVIAQSGLPKNKRQSKGLIDKTSAVIILQSYMERKERGF